MGILDFVFWLLVLAVIFFISIGAICMHYDTKKLEEENERLQEDLKKARLRRTKHEYKKAKEVK